MNIVANKYKRKILPSKLNLWKYAATTFKA
jgi:hypothetical protein